MPRIVRLERADTRQDYFAPLAAGEAVMRALEAVPNGILVTVEIVAMTEEEYGAIDAVAQPWG